MGKKKKIQTPGKTILVKLLALSDELEILIEETEELLKSEGGEVSSLTNGMNSLEEAGNLLQESIDHFNDCKKNLLSIVAKI